MNNYQVAANYYSYVEDKEKSRKKGTVINDASKLVYDWTNRIINGNL